MLHRTTAMLDFVIFAFTAVLGLVILIAIFCFQDGKRNNRTATSPTLKSQEKIPGWLRPPADENQGDLKDLSAHGSLHEYLMHRHDNGRCPITAFWLEKQRVVSVCSPEGFRDTKRLADRPKSLFALIEPLIGAASIQYANGADWEQRRKALYPTLRGEDLDTYYPTFLRIVDKTRSDWSAYHADKQVSLAKECMTMSIKGIFYTCLLSDAFSDEEEIDSLAQNYHQCFNELESRLLIGPPPPGSEREASFEKHASYIRGLAKRVLNSHRDSTTKAVHVPFINALTQMGASEEQLISDVITFMIGGFHTSSYFLAWMLWYLSLNLDVQECLAEELTLKVGGDRGDKLKEYVQSEQTYMRKVQDETLRLSTLAPFAARISEEDVGICGYNVPAQTPIIHALGVASKNETIWKDVEAFDPSRFEVRRGPEFSPFGVPSQRKCPGFAFAYFEVGVFASVLLQNFCIEAVSIEPIKKSYGIVTKPENDLDLLVYVKPRPT